MVIRSSKPLQISCRSVQTFADTNRLGARELTKTQRGSDDPNPAHQRQYATIFNKSITGPSSSRPDLGYVVAMESLIGSTTASSFSSA
mmetsp:Transcript_8601/g.18171  ORF Transcript_8601/g.18171 Transcript_8601/m.18171 type:complete len:88 (-) Transcript_8601:705-968(-)